MKLKQIKTVIIGVLFISTFSILSAQTVNMQTLPKDQTVVGLKFEKPMFKNSTGVSFPTGVYNFSLNLPVSDGLNLYAVLPLNLMSVEYMGMSDSEEALGNLFVGLQTNSEIVNDKKTVLTFGAYLPTAKESAVVGLTSLSNFYNTEKALFKIASLYFNYAYHKLASEGLTYGFEVGSTVLIPTKENYGDTEVFAHYGATAGFKVNEFLFSAELNGKAIITEEVDEFADRFVHMINFGGQYDNGKINPYVYYGIYLKESMKNVLDGVLNIGVKVSL